MNIFQYVEVTTEVEKEQFIKKKSCDLPLC